ncbi:MAG: hypothetical protein WCG87_08130 [Bacteroidota bacterium]
MKVFSTLRRMAPAIAIIALVFLASCAAKSQKWGCPNHLEASSN